MRRTLPTFIAIIALLAATPLFAISTNLVDDVLRMARAGVDEQTMLAYVAGEQRPFEVTADDMIAMANAHVSQKVIQAVVDRSAQLKKAPSAEAPEGAPQQGAPSTTAALPPPWVPAYLWDPFWYLPTLDTKSGGTAVKPPAAAPPAAAPASAAPPAPSRISEAAGRAIAAAAAAVAPRSSSGRSGGRPAGRGRQ